MNEEDNVKRFATLLSKCPLQNVIALFDTFSVVVNEHKFSSCLTDQLKDYLYTNLADAFRKYVNVNTTYQSKLDQDKIESKKLLLILIDFFDKLLALKYNPAWLLEIIMTPQHNGLSLIHIMV